MASTHQPGDVVADHYRRAWVLVVVIAFTVACSSDDGEGSEPSNSNSANNTSQNVSPGDTGSSTPRADTVLCEDGDKRCLVITQRQVSCDDVCSERGSSCDGDDVSHWYRCSETATAVSDGRACDEVPADELASCGSYESMDCRCR